jgi:hypothetical protein
METNSNEFDSHSFSREILTHEEMWATPAPTLAKNDEAGNSQRNSTFRLPRYIEIGGCQVSRLKVEKFLTFVLSTCLVFLMVKALERMKVIKTALVPDIIAGFIMIFFLHDLLCLPGHENDDRAPPG